MFFSIDADERNVIIGWIAPDNPSAVPQVIFVSPDREELVVDATMLRPDVFEIGIHRNGHVGFRIDERVVPALATLDDVQLLDAATRTPIFRRALPEHLERKVFIFDAAAMPQRRIEQHIVSQFALSYQACERLPLETMINLITNPSCKSILFHGRSSLSRYATFIDANDYFRAAILRDPFEELAERLLFMSLMGKSDGANILAMYCTGMSPLLEFARNLPLNDQRGLVTAFRGLTDEQRQSIANPMVRMLGCTVEDIPTYHHVSVALDNLADMDVVGTRARYPLFRAMLSKIINCDILGPDEPAHFQTVETLAKSLAKIGIVEDLLELDSALYAYADGAITAGTARETDDPEAIASDTR